MLYRMLTVLTVGIADEGLEFLLLKLMRSLNRKRYMKE